MRHFYIPTKRADDWRQLLGDPKKHWRDCCSAKILATRWQSAGGFPTEVTSSFRKSGIPLLQALEFVAGFPEYKVALPGGGHPSQTDIMVLARAGHELVAVAVEGKVEEDFAKLVGEWRKKNTDGKVKQLAFLTERLGLGGRDLNGIRHQLLHRTVSALLTAECFAARHAVMLVHSFSPARTGFNDYAAFLQLFGLEAIEGTVQKAGTVHDTELYFSWTVGPPLHKP
jgi:hypothetical protein